MISHARRTLLVLALAVVAVFSLASAAGANTPKIANNYDNTCLLNDVGSVACTGANPTGVLGVPAGPRSVTYVPIAGIAGAVDLTVGEAHACAALADGTVKCWGDNGNFQLGQGGVGTGVSPTPLTVTVAGGTPLTGVTQVSAQEYFTCAVKSDGTAWCWGDGDMGQLGDGLSVDTSVAVPVSGLTGATSVSAGVNHACATKSDQTVWCWGSDADDQLGNGGDGQSSTPVKVIGADGAVDVGVGYGTSCALMADGTVRCWGEDDDGRVGDGAPVDTHQETAVPVVGLSGATQLSAGYSSTCALTSDRNVYCWGYNSENRILDVPDFAVVSATPRPAMAGAIALARQYESGTCAMFRGGSLRCGGRNDEGQLGLGMVSTPVTTTDVPGVDLVTLPYAPTSAAVAQVGKTALDKKKKTYTITTSSTYAPAPLVAPAEACTGAVSASTTYSYYVKQKVKGKKKPKRVKKTKTYKANGVLTLAGASCTSTIALKLPVKNFNGKKVKIKHAAAGNGSLTATEVSATYKLKKVKIKKAKKKSKK